MWGKIGTKQAHLVREGYEQGREVRANKSSSARTKQGEGAVVALVLVHDDL